MQQIKLSKKIIEQRHKKGISQEELARYIGVSKAAVSKWENEQSFPDILLLPELATYFDITIDELIGYEPQLTKEEIRKYYRYYAKKFDGITENELEEVFQECQNMVKKYYSCYPFLYQMAVLLLNQAVNAADRQNVLEYAVELLVRVREESEDPNLQKDAISAQVTCYLMQGEPQKARELLGEDIRPLSQETELLAQTYQQQGRECAIKQSLIQSMCANPLLEGLKGHPRFKQLEKQLKTQLEG